MGETDDRTLNDIEPSKQLERPPPSVRQRLSTHRVPPPSYVPPDPVIIGPPDSEDAGPGLGTPPPSEASPDSVVAQPHRPSAGAANPATIISDLREASRNRN
jgi:hypothetical protein